MKLQDSDIIAAARTIRDEQNDRLRTAPNPLKRRTSTPVWWTAVAAALVLGFLLGRGNILPDSFNVRENSGQMAEVKTPTREKGATSGESVIVREVIHEVVHDTIYETKIVRVPTSSNQRQVAKADPLPSSGCSMLCDDIRYDLLAGN